MKPSIKKPAVPAKRPQTKFNKTPATSGSSSLGGRSANYGRRPMKKAPKRFFDTGR